MNIPGQGAPPWSKIDVDCKTIWQPGQSATTAQCWIADMTTGLTVTVPPGTYSVPANTNWSADVTTTATVKLAAPPGGWTLGTYKAVP